MSTTPTIIYLALDQNYEPQFNGPGFTDKAAVGQAIMTRLKLFQGEWWENLLDGLPLFQSILGQPAGQNHLEAVNLLIQQRIQGTPYVLPNGISNIKSSFTKATRAFQFSCDVLTAFGTIQITNIPTPPPQGVIQS